MALGSIAAYTLFLLSKVGLKFAEKKRWLPSGYYNKKSIQDLKMGHISQALKSNAIALSKRPQSEKALVVRDLIAMRQDAEEQSLLREVRNLEQKIKDIELEMSRNRAKLRRIRKNDVLIQACALTLFLPVFISLAIVGFSGVNDLPFVSLLAFVSTANIAGFVYLSFTTLEDSRLRRILYQNEFVSNQAMLQKRLTMNKDRLNHHQRRLDATRTRMGVSKVE